MSKDEDEDGTSMRTNDEDELGAWGWFISKHFFEGKDGGRLLFD